MPPVEAPLLTMRDQICDAIRGEIIAGKLTQNQPIREQTFASRFGVSRNSVRDAFLQLSQEGILVYSPNRGVRVSSVPNKQDSDLFRRLRIELEIHCIERSLKHWVDEDDRKVKQLLETLKLACKQKDLKKITETDLAMHRFWVRKVSVEFESIWLSITVRMMIAYSKLEDYMQCFKEHEAIVEAIIRRDLLAVKKAIKQNIK